MDSFSECKAIEMQSLDDLIPFIQKHCHEGRFILTDKGRLSELLQRQVGDVVLNAKGTQKVVSIEVKCEKEKSQNLFLETWSNRMPGGRMGWMFTLNADYLFYYFLEGRLLLSIDFQKLWHWCFVLGRIYHYPEKPQGKNPQKNKTCGRCVPIEVIRKEVGVKDFKLGEALTQTQKDMEAQLRAKYG